MNALRHPRQDIYYWKCDRPVAFYGLQGPGSARLSGDIERLLRSVLAKQFPGLDVQLSPGSGQGNHLTFSGTLGDWPVFIRIEDGPERDDYMDVESHIIRMVGRRGVKTPLVIHSDATRTEVPFAWQVLERIPHPDLNAHQKAGTLNLMELAREVGQNVARWQAIKPNGFGPFDPAALRESGELRGFHARYDEYFFARLERHLDFLVEEAFLVRDRAEAFSRELESHRALLAETPGVLVHKDLALWNILGAPGKIVAFIDWDDAVSGDAMDDISSMACFHGGDVVGRILTGYAEVRPLPPEYRRHFWLHLLRNMITKAVIRVGAGYFKRTDGFFLIGAGSSGPGLREATEQRLDAAFDGLRNDSDPTTLL
jgi:aminoglycoside phosphotransferase (APT) family kinase protein